jgi:tetratricopeptide (TPR) repeat protein
MTLALSMIVRDSASSLAACLNSVKGTVDEICIADTGSKDETVSIAREFGAKIISIPWGNDFAGARNLALQQVHSDWVLSLDADEQLDPTAQGAISHLLGNPSFDACQVTIRNYVFNLNDRLWDRPAITNNSTFEPARNYPACIEHQNVRLFRRHPEIYFVGRVHESVGPTIISTNRKLGEANFYIHHFGLAADQATRARKNLLYRELGRRKIQEMPANAQAFFELGLVELDNFANPSEAQSLFERACTLNPRFALAWFFQGVAFLRLEKTADSLRCLKQAEALSLRTALVYEFTGDASYIARQFPAAKENYQKALCQEPENPHLLSKLGLALVRMGKAQQGVARIHAAVLLQPNLPDPHDRLIQALVALDQFNEAAGAAEHKLSSVVPLTDRDFLRAASLWAKAKNLPKASSVLEAGLHLHPQSTKLQSALAEIHEKSVCSTMEQFSHQKLGSP